MEKAKGLEFDEDVFEQKLAVVIESLLVKKEEIVEDKLEEKEEIVDEKPVISESVASYLRYL